MIAVCILMMSVGAMAQFVLAYCRTLLLTYAKIELSPRTFEVTGISSDTCHPNEFNHVMALARLARNPLDDAAAIRAVTAYYRVMATAGHIFGPISRAASAWIQQELSRCTYFAAVTLDRRLVHSAN